MNKMLSTRKAVIISDTSADSSWVKIKGFEWIQSSAWAPICIRDEVIGFLEVDAVVPDFFEQHNADKLHAFADQAALAIANARLFNETERLAITDGLTGLYNRRHIIQLAEKELERAKRYHHPLSLILFDVDRFKNINDTYGHPAGDKVLMNIAQYCLSRMRTTDIFGRFGGEEFLVLLPETDRESAIVVAERLRQEIEFLRVNTDERQISITISIGVVTYTSRKNISLEELMKRLDHALYAAKHEGRNRVVSELN
jgi:diguanylate cyclase (GGDEF)-like protein